jgi:proline racemase
VHIKTCDLVKFYGPPEDPSAQFKSTVVFGKGQVDRSPCGTGTSAKLAAMHAKGMIGVDEIFINESIIGTLFKGRIAETCKVGEYDAVVPEITGSAFITGFNTFVFDNRDPVRGGFVL